MILTLNGLFQKNFTLPLKIPYPQSSLLPLLFVFFYDNVCIVISDCNHPFDTGIFTHSLTRIYLLQLKIHIWMESFWNQKFLFFHKSHKLFFNKTVCWYKLIFLNFSSSTGYSVWFLNKFWNVYDFWQMLFYKFSCLKKANTAASKFYVFNCLKISVLTNL